MSHEKHDSVADLLAQIERLLAVNGNDAHLMRIANWLDLQALRRNYSEAVLEAHRLLHLARIELVARPNVGAASLDDERLTELAQAATANANALYESVGTSAPYISLSWRRMFAMAVLHEVGAAGALTADPLPRRGLDR